jgi:hypothetical protein
MAWPIWVALALVMALANQGTVRRGLLMIAAGLLAMQVLAFAPPEIRYLGAGALWVSVGADAIRRQHVTSGALLVLSGLCYFAAETVAAPWELFAYPLLAADAFGVAALAGYWYAGRSDRMGKGRFLGAGADRGGFLAGRGGCDVVAKEAGR